MPVNKSDRSIIRKNSAGSDFVQRRINLIEGTNVTLTVGADAANNEVDVTIAASGSGDVTKVGTPVNNQIGVWTGDGTIEGDADLTWDGSTLLVANDADSASVQIAILEGDRATMADNDEAYVSLRLSDDAGTQKEVARLTWVGTDVNAGTNVDGRIDFAVMTAGTLADELQLDGTALAPSTTDGLALGTSSLNFADLFLDSGAVVNFDSGDVTLTHSAGALALAGGKLTITIADTENLVPLTVVQNDSTNDPTAMRITNNGGGYALDIGGVAPYLLKLQNTTAGAGEGTFFDVYNDDASSRFTIGVGGTTHATIPNEGFISTINNFDLLLGANNNVRLRIDSATGNVGISTGDIDFLTSTGNVIVSGADPKRTLTVMSAGMWPSTTNGCAALAKVEATTNDVDYQVLDFDQTTQEFAQFSVVMPDGWDAGTVTFKAIWTTTASSGVVVWELQGRSYDDDDAIDQTWGSAIEVSDTVVGAADIHETGESAAVTLAGTPAAGEYCHFRIARDPANASDTLAADARLLGVRIEWVRSQYND